MSVARELMGNPSIYLPDSMPQARGDQVIFPMPLHRDMRRWVDIYITHRKTLKGKMAQHSRDGPLLLGGGGIDKTFFFLMEKENGQAKHN